MREAGFTIVEVVTALLVLAVGLLGLMGTVAAATRAVAQGHRLQQAGVVAWRQVERLRGGACAPPGNGTFQAGELEVWWSVWSAADGAASRVQVVVRTPTGTGFRTYTLSSLMPC
jgi:Tfp pilus assembly protein PilV